MNMSARCCGFVTTPCSPPRLHDGKWVRRRESANPAGGHLLGPNGAGKTTLVPILSTLLRPSCGQALVLGHDVVGEPLAVRRHIGLGGQFAAVDAELTGRENIEMVARLCRLPAAEGRRRADEPGCRC